MRSSSLSSAYRNAREEQFAMKSRSRNKKPEQTASGVKTHTATTLNGDTVTITTLAAGGGERNKSQNNTAGSSVSSAYQAAKEQNNDLPVSSETSARTGIGAGRKAPDDSTWFQKSSYFEDGYDFGDVTKTAIATARDFKDNMAAGLLGMGETALDTLVSFGPAVSQMQFIQSGGYYHLPTQAAFDTTQKAAKEAVSDFVAKDLYDEEALAKRAYENSLARKILPVDIENGSVFGERTDALAQSGGQLLGKVALSPVVPWPVTTAVTSFGGEMENALRQGATYEQAVASAGVTAAWDTLPELLSGGISFGSKTADVPLTRWITDNIPNKAVGTALNFGLDVLGEGTEGAISQFGHNLGSALYRDEDLGEILFGEEARQGYRDSFLGDAVLGGLGSAGKLLPGTADLDSQIRDLKRQLEAVRHEKALAELKAEYDKHVPGVLQDKTGKDSGNGISVHDTTQSTIAFESPFLNGIIPKGAELESIRNIAGAGSNTAIRDVDRLTKMYGGESLQWQKKGGIIKTNNFKYDVHWYELGKNHFEEKVKEVKPDA